MNHLDCFKALDIRGRLGEELTDDLARKIGRGYAAFVEPSRVVVGHDIRLSSPGLARAVAEGLCESGVDVVDIGRCGTEEVYFATAHLGLDGGIMVTASHNPKDYNGFKLVREGARPLSADSGLADIERRVFHEDFPDAGRRGSVDAVNVRPDYVRHLLSYVDREQLRELTIVVNAGNGGAGEVVDLLEPHLPCRLVKVYHEPDGNFPHGVPNPLLPENRKVTADAVVEHGAALGIAWDGDFDRCFLYDEKGEFLEGYYIVGLLAESLLERNPGAKIVHDPRLTWNTLEIVREAGGEPVQCKSGHAFIKEVMRREDAIYGGEMSAHHYFRDFSYADSGMIPWLLVYELMGRRGQSLSEMVAARVKKFPASGEINRRVEDADATLRRVHERYAGQALRLDETDGYGFEFERWRFNLRKSNTEPLIRLNVESRGDEALMREKTAELLGCLGGSPS